MKYLKSEELYYITVGEFLSDLKKEFYRGDNEIIKITELKKSRKVKQWKSLYRSLKE